MFQIFSIYILIPKNLSKLEELLFCVQTCETFMIVLLVLYEYLDSSIVFKDKKYVTLIMAGVSFLYFVSTFVCHLFIKFYAQLVIHWNSKFTSTSNTISMLTLINRYLRNYITISVWEMKAKILNYMWSIFYLTPKY